MRCSCCDGDKSCCNRNSCFLVMNSWPTSYTTKSSNSLWLILLIFVILSKIEFWKIRLLFMNESKFAFGFCKICWRVGWWTQSCGRCSIWRRVSNLMPRVQDLKWEKTPTSGFPAESTLNARFTISTILGCSVLELVVISVFEKNSNFSFFYCCLIIFFTFSSLKKFSPFLSSNLISEFLLFFVSNSRLSKSVLSSLPSKNRNPKEKSSTQFSLSHLLPSSPI